MSHTRPAADGQTTVPALPVASLRADFPALSSGEAYFDGPGGTQTPRQVGEAIAATLTGPLSNRGRAAISQRNADDAVVAFRAAMADYLGADSRGIVHGRSATQLTYDFSRTLAKAWRPGDEVVVSRLDHDANVRPWVQAAAARGAAVRWLDFDPQTAEIDPADLDALLTDRTRLVAFTGASNLLGTIPDVARLAAAAHAAGALVYLDAVHAAAHAALSLAELGVDFLVCSPYKFLGPHCGVLAAAPATLEALAPDKLAPATDAVPERFEYGTLPYEALAGVTAAVDYLAGVADRLEPRAQRPPVGAPGEAAKAERRSRLTVVFAAIGEHEERLRREVESRLAELPGVTNWSRARRRTPTLLLTFTGASAAEVSAALQRRGVVAPAGSFYALEPAKRLGLGEAGGLRVGLAPYTDGDDVERLLAALAEALPA